MIKKAVFPGSFDPITLGHIDIIKRAIPLFDEIVVAIGINAEKKYMFTLEERKKFIQDTFSSEDKITVETYSGLTVNFCKAINANFILRGLRNPTDFEFERAIAQANGKLANIESVFLLTSAETSFISSTIARDVLKNNGDASSLVPTTVVEYFDKK